MMTTLSQLLHAGFDPTGKISFDEIDEQNFAHIMAGVTCAEFEKDPDNPQWEEPAGLGKLKQAAELIHAADFNTPEWTRFYIGRFAVSHSPADLNEIVRRARHFDGSTATIQVQTNAVALLAKGVHDFPESVGRGLKAAGYNFGNVKPGNYPPTSRPLAPVYRLSQADPAVSLNPASPDPASNPAMVDVTSGEVFPVPPSLRYFSELLFTADIVDGSVDICSFTFSITEAIAIELEIVKATRALLLPLENWAWRDDTMSPTVHSQLFDDTGTLQGFVLQDRNTAKYSGFFGAFAIDHGREKLLTVFDDMNNAKFAVASKIREKQSQSKG